MTIPSLFAHRGAPGLDLTVGLTHLTDRDPKLGAVIARVGSCALTKPRPLTPFAYLLRAITYQQLSTKAASTIHGRVRALFDGRRDPDPARVLATPPARLRSAGLSAAKTLAIHDLARHTLAGTVPPMATLRRMEDAEVVARLTQVRGVGVWTVEMFLMFQLGRPDVLPLSDLGIRKGFLTAISRPRRRDKWGLPHPDAITRRATRWRPWRTVACWYLWRALDTPAGQPPA